MDRIAWDGGTETESTRLHGSTEFTAADGKAAAPDSQTDCLAGVEARDAQSGEGGGLPTALPSGA